MKMFFLDTGRIRARDRLRASYGSLVVVPIFILVAFAGITQAQVVDQRNDSLVPTIAWSITAQSVWQSFTPTRDSMTFVDLFMEGSHLPGTPDAGVFLRIRDGSTAGPILATSPTVTVADNNLDYVHFELSSMLLLEVGHLYFIEPRAIAGVASYFADGRPQDTYSGGAATFSSSANNPADLMFREGTVPEPTCGGTIVVAFLCIVGLQRH